MTIITGKIVDEIDKDTYRCIIEIPGTGKVQGYPVRFETEPIIGDEVLCWLFLDPFSNSAYYIPLKTLHKPDEKEGMNTFTGIYREGFKIEFNDSGIFISGKKTREGDGDDNSHINVTENTIEIIEGDGLIKLDAENKSLEISGFSSKIKMGGNVTTPTTSGPFCGLSNCLFSGAPHKGDTLENN